MTISKFTIFQHSTPKSTQKRLNFTKIMLKELEKLKKVGEQSENHDFGEIQHLLSRFWSGMLKNDGFSKQSFCPFEKDEKRHVFRFFSFLAPVLQLFLNMLYIEVYSTNMACIPQVVKSWVGHPIYL